MCYCLSCRFHGVKSTQKPQRRWTLTPPLDVHGLDQSRDKTQVIKQSRYVAFRAQRSHCEQQYALLELNHLNFSRCKSQKSLKCCFRLLMEYPAASTWALCVLKQQRGDPDTLAKRLLIQPCTYCTVRDDTSDSCCQALGLWVSGCCFSPALKSLHQRFCYLADANRVTQFLSVLTSREVSGVCCFLKVRWRAFRQRQTKVDRSDKALGLNNKKDSDMHSTGCWFFS